MQGKVIVGREPVIDDLSCDALRLRDTKVRHFENGADDALGRKMRPQLNKDERRPKKGPTLDKPAGWRPELDKFWRHRPELLGPLG